MKKNNYMPKHIFFLCSVAFGFIIVLANYCVQFMVFPANSSVNLFGHLINLDAITLTYGALTYPFSFLLLDILSEKYNKKDVMKTLWIGLFIAFVPSFLLSELRIAIASICAFIVSQNLDVLAFFYLKKKFPSLWWLRNNASTILSQFVDTMIFFHIAFLFIFPYEQVISMLLFDFSIKIFLTLLDTPLFYAFAIKNSNKAVQ